MGNNKSKGVETSVVKVDTYTEIDVNKKVGVDEFTKALDTLSNYYLEVDLCNLDSKITKNFIGQLEGLSECHQNVCGSQIQIDNFLTGSNSNLYPTLDFTEKSGLFEQKEKEFIENIHKLGNYYKKLSETVILELGRSENLEDTETYKTDESTEPDKVDRVDEVDKVRELTFPLKTLQDFDLLGPCMCFLGMGITILLLDFIGVGKAR